MRWLMSDRRALRRLFLALWRLPRGKWGLLLTGSLLVLALLCPAADAAGGVPWRN